MVSFIFTFLFAFLTFFLGQLEETLSTTFMKSANLRALMLKEGCPPEIKNCSGHFSKFVDPQVRSTFLMDIAHFLALAEEEANEPQDVKGKMTAITAGLYKAKPIFRVQAQCHARLKS